MRAYCPDGHEINAVDHQVVVRCEVTPDSWSEDGECVLGAGEDIRWDTGQIEEYKPYQCAGGDEWDAEELDIREDKTA